MQREFVQACVCTSINPTKSSPVFLKKNRNPPACGHITPDPPAPPWSMLLPNACRHPNRNGCFFWTAFQAKRCNNIDLGERGRASFFAMSLKGCFFWRTRTQSGKDFVVYGCANTSLNKLPFALDTTSIQTHSHLQSCYPANKEAQYFFGLWLCKRKLEQIPFCTRQNPIETHFHRHSCYPQTKNVPPEAELHKLRVSRSARMVQCTATKRCKYHGVSVLWTTYRKCKHIVFYWCFLITFWENKLYLQCFVAMRCGVRCTCTVQNIAKHDVCAPLSFHQQNTAILLLEAWRHSLH